MNNLNQFAEFFGWATISGLCFLCAMTFFLSVMQKFTISLHQKIFKIEEGALRLLYFQFIAIFKLLLIIFFLLPYIALRIMN